MRWSRVLYEYLGAGGGVLERSYVQEVVFGGLGLVRRGGGGFF